MVDLDLLNYLESFLTEKRKIKFEEVLSQRTKHFTIAIEDVNHLHNTSAVVRSCDVFGIQEINIIEATNADRIDNEIALGAQKWVTLNRYNSAKSCIKNLRQNGYQIVATTPHNRDCDIHDFDITRRSCLIFGKETEGISDFVVKQADCYLNIPMTGFTESLNISVSVAIILHQLTSKLRASSLKWHLTNEEKRELRFDWCSKTIKSFDHILERYHNQM